MWATRTKRTRIAQALAGAAMAVTSLAMAVGPASGEAVARDGRDRPGELVRVEGIVGVVHADPTDEGGEGYVETMVTNERDPSQGVTVTFPRALADRYGGIGGLTSKRVAVTGVDESRGRESTKLNRPGSGGGSGCWICQAAGA